MKSIVAGHRISASIAQTEDALTRHTDDTRRKTMGVLVGDMMGSFLVPAGYEGLPDVPEEASGASFAILQQIVLPPEEFDRITTEYRALVTLRNSLVHNFLEEHDLRTEAGRNGARQALVLALDRVTHAYSNLRGFVSELDAARKAMAEVLAKPEVLDSIASGRLP